MTAIKLGDSGELVKYAQELLNSHNIACSPDGVFGKGTLRAVREFQTNNLISPDGVVGEETWAALEGPKNKEKTPSFEFGRAFSAVEFADLVKKTHWINWRPSLIVIHHTAAPSLAQRPNGFIHQHMINIKDFYKSKGWSAGPHLFVDENKIWTFSPLTERGIHAVSFNKTGIGLELLGDFDTEDPWSGRGLKVVQTTVEAVKALMAALNLNKECIRFHRDDPKTNKTCPGVNFSKKKFLDLL